MIEYAYKWLILYLIFIIIQKKNGKHLQLFAKRGRIRIMVIRWSWRIIALNAWEESIVGIDLTVIIGGRLESWVPNSWGTGPSSTRVLQPYR